MQTHCKHGHDLSIRGRTKEGKCKECKYAQEKRYRDRNKEKQKLKFKRYREQNLDELRSKERERYHANLEERRQKNRDWRKANIERKRELNRAFRARRRALGNITADQLIALKRDFGHECYYCKRPDPTDIEHKTPVCRGGTNDPSNLVMSCRECNNEKGTLTAEEYFERLVSEGQAVVSGTSVGSLDQRILSVGIHSPGE